MKISDTFIKGLFVAQSDVLQDTRGSFSRLYCGLELSSIIADRTIVQINHSCTISVGTVRGMHYQLPPFSEMKLVRCIRGMVWDIVIDLRTGSPTFLQWYAEELSPGNRKMMIIPEGFAHGFQALEPGSELIYLHTEYYTPGSEAGLNPMDPLLLIKWPMPVAQLSDRDSGHAWITQDFKGIAI
jgi:dTDP-4-dehydrorhamnose 3,5-epimerase